jgi:CheY-like chemotaxis protein
MPEIDGIELVDRLRSRNVMLPVILISGRVSNQLRNLAQQSGLTRVLEKPLSDDALVENIRGALVAAA